MKVDSEKGTVEGLQDATCLDWISRDFPERCARFDAERWKVLSRDLPVRPCTSASIASSTRIARAPSRIIAVTWHEAGALCDERGARLCTEDEWTFACEGEDARPYPTGFERRREGVRHRPALAPLRRAAPRGARQRAAIGEIDFVWQGEASGSHPLCRSPFGVYDTTGNVDEWTRSTQREGYAVRASRAATGAPSARAAAPRRAHTTRTSTSTSRASAAARTCRSRQKPRPTRASRRRGPRRHRFEAGADFAGGVEEAAFEDEVALGLPL